MRTLMMVVGTQRAVVKVKGLFACDFVVICASRIVSV